MNEDISNEQLNVNEMRETLSVMSKVYNSNTFDK